MRGGLLVLLPFLGALTFAKPAHADGGAPFPLSAVDSGEDAIMLRDGTVLRGRILERVEGDHTTIRLADGTLRRVGSSEIQSPDVPTSGSSISGLTIAGAFGLVATAGGAGTLLGSLAIHDDGTRHSVQIGGGVALGAGLTIVIVVGAIGLSQRLAVVR